MSMAVRDIRFADLQMLRYTVGGFARLEPRQKLLVYYLAQASLWGRDILWDQNCRLGLALRSMLEAVYDAHRHGKLTCQDDYEWEAFVTYLRCVWFANGVHHHYAMDKMRPGFSEQFLRDALHSIGYEVDEELMRLVFDPDFMPKRVNLADGEDLLETSSMNYYAPGISQAEAEAFYGKMKTDDPRPPMYGLNSRLERDGEGSLVERVWRSGGMYGPYIDKIVSWLQKASEVCDSPGQREVILTLIDFYKTGDLRTFDRYCIQWVQQTDSEVDFTNGFTEVYGDPLGLKASWEGYVNIVDHEATRRAQTLSDWAQWFEDHSPVDPRFKKTECRGVSARVVEAAMLGGDLYPSSAIGINLPNSNWVRQEYGSKSVTIGNLTRAYDEAARGSGFYEEFVLPEALPMVNAPLAAQLDGLHTDRHECLGHGSGQLLPGTDPDALGAYGSAIEEARADLFALYYIADPKLVELGLLPDQEAYRSQYYTYMMNGALTQLVRIEEGRQIEEAHMRNRALIARWALAHTQAMKLVKRNGKTYLEITDYDALRTVVGQLLAEIQRIKSEGDQAAARCLVEDYGVEVDETLHHEMLQRYRALDLAPYKGFINPCYSLVCDKEGKPVDVEIVYGESYDEQMMRYGREYSL